MSGSSSPALIATLAGALAPEGHVTAHDLQLAHQVRAGDVTAFTTLFDRYFADLHRFALIYTTPERAEDAVQDVFARIWEARAHWEIRTSVAQYLFGAVRNRALQLTQHDTAVARREAQAAIAQITTINSIGISVLEAAELQAYLTRAVETLPPRCRAVFILSRVRRMSQQEIADTLGIAIPTIKVQLGRALRVLHEAWRTYEEGKPQKNARNTSAAQRDH